MNLESNVSRAVAVEQFGGPPRFAIATTFPPGNCA